MLINLDQSKNRRRKMRAEFVRQGLPMFERVPGVLVTEVTVSLPQRPLTSSLLFPRLFSTFGGLFRPPPLLSAQCVSGCTTEAASVPGGGQANVDQYTPRRTSGSLKLADYGCALAHRRAWQRVVDGAHEWVVILEDDAELVDGVNLTDLPAVPHDADLLLFRAGTIMRWAAVCRDTEAFRAYWGFGMVGCVDSSLNRDRSTSRGNVTPTDTW